MPGRWRVPRLRTRPMPPRPSVWLGLVLLCALVVRWPYLLDWPAFTDETLEGVLTLAVAQGHQRPWTSVEHYIGPWHIYLQAGLFHLLGVSVWLPRALTTALNVVAVGLTYGLARRVAGTAGGLVAAGLTGVAPMWVLISSHVAWAASTAPTYVLGAVLAAHLALAPPSTTRRWQGAWLIMAGLLLGLAGQMHPITFLIAPGIALAVAWGRAGRARLRTPWPWLGLVGIAVGYGPMVLYNVVVQPGGSIAAGQEQGYAWHLTVDPLVYAGRAPGMWWAQARMVAGVVEQDLLPAWPGGLLASVTLGVVGLVVWGTVVLWRRGERLVPLSLVSLPLLLPFITAYSGGLFADRYAAPLVGLAAVAAGAAVAQLGRGRGWAVTGLGLLLGLLPVIALAEYYGRAGESPNAGLRATAELLVPARGCIRVVLDQRLAYQQFDGGGTALRALRMTLSYAGLPWETRIMHRATLRDAAREAAPAIVVGVLSPASVKQFGTAGLTRVTPEAQEHVYGYGVYVYRARALPTCPPAPSAAPAPPSGVGRSSREAVIAARRSHARL